MESVFIFNPSYMKIIIPYFFPNTPSLYPNQLIFGIIALLGFREDD